MRTTGSVSSSTFIAPALWPIFAVSTAASPQVAAGGREVMRDNLTEHARSRRLRWRQCSMQRGSVGSARLATAWRGCLAMSRVRRPGTS